MNPSDMTITQLQDYCHAASHAAGWWHHPDTGLPYIPGDSNVHGTLWWRHMTYPEQALITHYWPFVVATKIALIHSEVSEGLEAFRTNANDDKLRTRLGLECELADSLIRQFDLAGAMRRAAALGVVDSESLTFDLGFTVEEKLAFNKKRPDHTAAARRASNGKRF